MNARENMHDANKNPQSSFNKLLTINLPETSTLEIHLNRTSVIGEIKTKEQDNITMHKIRNTKSHNGIYYARIGRCQ